jgi:hypothetical protein
MTLLNSKTSEAAIPPLHVALLLYMCSGSGPKSLPNPGSALDSKASLVDVIFRQGNIRECQNLSDKVYGFLGLFSDSLRERIVVDYRKQPVEVFTGAMQALIEETNDLDILCYSKTRNIKSDSGSGIPDLPSWVCDWSAKAGDGVSSLSLRFGDLYNASTSMKASYQFLNNDFVLQVTGVCIGRILHLQTDPYFSSAKVEQLLCSAIPNPRQLVDFLTSLNAFRKLLGLALESDLDDFVRTASCGVFQISRSLFVSSFDQFFSDVEILTMEDHVAKLSSSPGMLSLALALHASSFARVYFTFSPHRQEEVKEDDVQGHKSARNIGCAPHMALEGDKLCVLLGCRTPVILRQVGNYHKLIGDVYVNGYMHGEAIDHVNSGDLELEDFLLS